MIFMSFSPETRPSSLEGIGSLQTVCLGGRWVMSRTQVLETHLGLSGFENHDVRELAPCLSFSRNVSPRTAVAIEIGNTLMLSRGSESICSQAGLFAGGRASRSADTFVDCASAEQCFLPGLPAY